MWLGWVSATAHGCLSSCGAQAPELTGSVVVVMALVAL